MDRKMQAKIILEELREEYSVPFYFEEDALQGIEKGLLRIEKEGREYDG